MHTQDFAMIILSILQLVSTDIFSKLLAASAYLLNIHV